MVFSSTTFIFLFLPLALASHFLLHPRLRDIVLLIVSVSFYVAGEPESWWVLAISLVLNYCGGLLLWRLTGTVRWWVLVAIVGANLVLLFTFKYAGFVAKELIGAGHLTDGGALGKLSGILLPLGISFFTFHGISYVVDVYRSTSRPQYDPVRFSIYILFFPQLIAGPIIRYHDVEKQLEHRNADGADFYEGFVRFAVGLAKKMLLANPLGVVADAMFAIPSAEIDTVSAWVGVIAYTFQIYFDFSGYSDMAIGLARMFGVRFPENFNYPYISQSITEFWRRWHISLSLWFRDYVYVPLGGNRFGRVRTYANLVTVFLLCGIWHGANWNFLVWGAYYGFFLVIERALAGKLPEVPRAVRHIYTLVVVAVGWVIFRAQDLGQAMDFISAMFFPVVRQGTTWALYSVNIGILVLLAIAAIASTPVLKTVSRRLPAIPPIQRDWVHAFSILLIFIVAVSSVVASTYNPFIYFRF